MRKKIEYPYSKIFNDLKQLDTFQIACKIVESCKNDWERNPNICVWTPTTIELHRINFYEYIQYRSLTQRNRLFMATDDVLRSNFQNLSEMTRHLYWTTLWIPVEKGRFEFKGFPDITRMTDEVLKIAMYNGDFRYDQSLKAKYPKDVLLHDPAGKTFTIDNQFEYFLPPMEICKKEKCNEIPYIRYSETSCRFLRDEINRLDMMSYMDTV